MNVTNQDAKRFGAEMRNELYTRERPWPTMDQCIVIGFIEARQRLLDDFKERLSNAEESADSMAEPTGIVGWAFKEAIEELEKISQPLTT